MQKQYANNSITIMSGARYSLFPLRMFLFRFVAVDKKFAIRFKK